MRFEKLVWAVLALFLSGGGWFGVPDDGAVSDGGKYEAADGGSDVPPPGR